MRPVVLALISVAVTFGALVLYWQTTRPSPIARVTRDAGTPSIERRVVIDGSRVADASNAATEQRVAAVASLQRSGPAEEEWNPHAGEVFDAVAAMPSVAVSARGCYVVGCGAMLTFTTEAAYRAELARIEELPAYRVWTGGKQITSPEVQHDGHVIAEILLYRPD